MIVDASALCAILLHEPERDRFTHALGNARVALVSPIQVWEASVSIEVQQGDGAVLVEQLIANLSLKVTDIGVTEATLAFSAWNRFGKGRHPAGLNLGDCFAYALASSRDLPLLYKGNDFTLTDVRSAL